MEKNSIMLPSDLIQKEYESNPLKIIDLMRKGKDTENKNTIIESEDKIDILNENFIPNNNYFLCINEKEKDNIYFCSQSDNFNKNNFINNTINSINSINIQKNENNFNNIDYNINNHYLSQYKDTISNDLSSSNSKKYLGNNINNINNSNSSKKGNYVKYFKKNYKYILLNNIEVLLMNLNSQKGSIITQDFLDEIDNKQLFILFNSIKPYISDIMCLEYGNYFIQKLIKKLNIEQRLLIYQIIEPKFIEIATNKSGTHSIQALIDCIDSPLELIALDVLLNKNMLLLFLDENAYHIIMKIILDISEDKRNNLNLFIVMNAEKIIINSNGAFCVNKFICKNSDLKLRTLLIQNLQNNIHNLIINSNSCNIFLLILEKYDIKYGLFIIKYIQDNFVYLSSHPTTIVFVIRTLYYLQKYNIFELGILIWFVYKNNILLNYLLSNTRGLKVLNVLVNLSDDEQKKYICIKLNKIHKIKND
jgi:hypothetical protein